MIIGPETQVLWFAGDCIPPHIDHHDFVRPFVTVSLQSEQEILFSEKIVALDAGVFSGKFKMPLPPGAHPRQTRRLPPRFKLSNRF